MKKISTRFLICLLWAIVNMMLVSSLEAAEKKIVQVEVKGNQHISTTTVISKVKARTGLTYTPTLISEDIKRLYATGFFSNVKVDLEEAAEGLQVIFTVTEKPLVEKVVLKGRKFLRQDKIRASIETKEGQPFDERKIAKDLKIIEDLYYKYGFPRAKASYETELDPKTNKVVVTITIEEDKRFKIRRIQITGNRAFSARRLLKLMKTKRAWLFRSGFLKDEELQEDMERLRSFYKKEGFLDIEVANRVDFNLAKSSITIFIELKEGKHYFVGSLDFRGNSIFAQEELRRTIENCLPGKTFSQEGMKEDTEKILDKYFEKGYIFAEVEPTPAINPQSGQVDIGYAISEHGPAYINMILIRGNTKTRDSVIRRELRMKPGDRFDGKLIKRSKERLQNLGYFEEVNFDTEPTSEPDKRDLVVEVKEAKTGEFSFGGGYSTVDEFIGFVEVAQKNFDFTNFPSFTGGGQDIRLRAEIGSVRRNYELSFTEPWFFDYPVSVGFDLYNKTFERETDIGYGYSMRQTGGDIRLGKELTEYLKAGSTYRCENIKIYDIPDDATSELKKEAGSATISSMEFTLTHDTRDNVFNPTMGHEAMASAQVAGGPFGGKKNFTKYFVDASRYQTVLFKDWVLQLRIRSGWADAFDNTPDVPIYERYYAGGAYTIRGYRERKIGPIDAVTSDPIGGNSLLVGNVEYTIPILDFVKGAAFYDVGNVWSKASDYASGGLKSGVGVGVRIKTPLGPIRLDYGIPLNKEPGSPDRGSGRLHFSVSRGF